MSKAGPAKVDRLRTFRSALLRAKYSNDLILRSEVNGTAFCAGYAYLPQVARNACVVAVDETSDTNALARISETTGAPVLFSLSEHTATAWRWSNGVVEAYKTLRIDEIVNPTPQLIHLVDPLAIHRAKTLGRFDKSYQLEFVDVGFLQEVEAVQGAQLRRLLERVVAELRHPEDRLSPQEAHQVLTLAFWVLAARMLRDHQVPGFFSHAEFAPRGSSVIAAIARHYAASPPILLQSKKWASRVDRAASVAFTYGLSLRHVSAEAIGYVYESALIAKQTRKDLGTHSTPPFVVEYVVGRMRKLIRSIPADERIVVEPACGHGAFLVAALQVLVEEMPAETPRTEYLRSRIRGLDIDLAAKEMARLSLTLADVPFPDGWQLAQGDMFEDCRLERLCHNGTILLCNPPFETFPIERRKRKDDPVIFSNKAAEMVRRALPALSAGAAVGLILPSKLVRSRQQSKFREFLLANMQITEICSLPDKIFRYANAECTIVIGVRRTHGTEESSPIVVRQVRESGRESFRKQGEVSEEQLVRGSDLLNAENLNFNLPRLRRLWRVLQGQKLGDIASVQQGLTYHGHVRKAGHETRRASPFEDSMPGIAPPGETKALGVLDKPLYCFMDANPDHILSARGGMPTNEPQVIVNGHPLSIGPWRIKAMIDPSGSAVPGVWNAVRPKATGVSVEVLWAICNSTVANAYFFARGDKRHMLASDLARVPCPPISASFCEDITGRVRRLLDAAVPGADRAHLGAQMAEIDWIILGAFGLFAESEQRLLSLFGEAERPGLPFPQRRSERLPQYLAAGIDVELPPASADLRQALGLRDLDAEIEDGFRELAEIRRWTESEMPGIAAREAWVRGFIDALCERSADLGVRKPRY